MQKIVPCLWYDGDAEPAARHYAKLIPGSQIQTVTHYPDGGQEVYHLHMHVMGGPRPWLKG